MLADTSDPRVDLDIISPAFYHYRVQVGDEITVTEPHKAISAKTFRVINSVMNIDRATIRHKAYKVLQMGI